MSTQGQVVDALSTDHLHADLKGRSVRGGLLTITSQGTQFVLTSISTIVLARLLTPADFGLVAMVTAVTGLGQSFADFGLSEATIQRQEITHEQVSTLFWINVSIGLTLMMITIALGPVFAWFYHEPRLRNIAIVASFIFLIGGLRVQHNALLKRQMRFVSLAIRDVVSYAIAVPFAVTLAWKGAGYWAIVALPLSFCFLQMVITWLMVRWLPGLPRRGAKVGSMIAFGGNVAASYLVLAVNRSADSVLIGWYWGAHLLGLYSRAYNLLMLPVRQLSVPASSVAVPAFSRLQNDPERFARYYLRGANLMLWITTPVFGFLFVSAHPVIILVLGHQWGEAAPVFQILVISAMAQLLLELNLWLFVGRGDSARLLKLLLVISPIMIGSFALGLPFGIKGVALSGSLVLLVMLPWILQYTFRGSRLSLQRLGQAMLCPVALSLAGVLSAELALRVMAPHGIASQLLISALAFAAAYALSALARPVREEAMSLRELLNELRLSRQTA